MFLTKNAIEAASAHAQVHLNEKQKSNYSTNFDLIRINFYFVAAKNHISAIFVLNPLLIEAI